MTADAAKDAIAAIEEALSAALDDGSKSQKHDESRQQADQPRLKSVVGGDLGKEQKADNDGGRVKEISSAKAKVMRDTTKRDITKKAGAIPAANTKMATSIKQSGAVSSAEKPAEKLKENSRLTQPLNTNQRGDGKQSSERRLIAKSDVRSEQLKWAKKEGQEKREATFKSSEKPTPKAGEPDKSAKSNWYAGRNFKSTGLSSPKPPQKTANVPVAHGQSKGAGWIKDAANDQYESGDGLHYRVGANAAKQRALTVSAKIETGGVSHKQYWIAAVASLLWLAGGVLLITRWYGLQFGELSSFSNFGQIINDPKVLFLAFGLAVPVALFFVLAVLSVRAAEMRFMTLSMMEIANKLIDPDEAAEKTVSSVGTAIRREINSMSDGIEKAVERASDLEKLVSNEVKTLESAYADRENRIRSLVDDLAKHHTMVVNDAKKAREVISGTQSLISKDISVAAEKFNKEVKTNSEQVVGSIGDSQNALTTKLQSNTEQLTTSFGQLKTKLLDELEGMGRSIDRRFSDKIVELAKTSDRAGEGMIAIFAEHSRKAKDHFGGVQREFSETLSDNLKGMEKTFTSASNDAIGRFSHSASAIGVALRTSGESLIEGLNREGREKVEALASSAHKVSENVTKIGNDLLEKLDDSCNRIDDAITINGTNFTEKLDKSMTQISTSLLSSGEQAAHKVEDAILTAEGVFDSRGGGLADLLDAQKSEIVSSLDGHTLKLDKAIKHGVANFNNNAIKRENEFIDSVNGCTSKLASVLENNGSKMVNRLNEQTGMIGHRITERLDTFDSQINKRIKGVSDDIHTYTENFYNEAGTRITQLTEGLDEKTVLLSAAVKDGADSFDASLAEHIERADNILADGVSKIEIVFNDKTEQAKTSLAVGEQVIAKLLQEKMDNVSGAMVANSEMAIKRISEQQEKLSKLFETMASEINLIMDERSTSLERITKHRIEDVLDNLAEGSFKLTQEINDSAAGTLKQMEINFLQANDALQARVGDIDKIINTDGRAISVNLEELCGELAGNINEQTDRFSQLSNMVSVRGEELAGRLQKASTVIIEAVDSKGEQISARIARESMRSVESLRDSIEERLLETSSSLKEEANKVSEELSQSAMSAYNKVSDTVTTLSNLFDARKQDFSEGMSSFNEELRASIGARTVELAEILTIKGGGLISNLRDRSSEVSAGLSDACDMMVSSLNTRGKEIVSEIRIQSQLANELFNETRESLKSDVAVIYSQIKSSNTSLSEVLSSTKNNLLLVERELAKTTGEFRKTIDEASDTTKRTSTVLTEQTVLLKKTSLSTLSQVGDIATRFEHQAKELSESISMVQTNNKMVENQLTTRVKSMKELSTTLVLQARAIEDSLKTLINELHGSIDKLQNRGGKAMVNTLSKENLLQDIQKKYAQLEELGKKTSQDMARVARLVEETISSGKTTRGKNRFSIRDNSDSERVHTPARAKYEARYESEYNRRNFGVARDDNGKDQESLLIRSQDLSGKISNPQPLFSEDEISVVSYDGEQKGIVSELDMLAKKAKNYGALKEERSPYRFEEESLRQGSDEYGEEAQGGLRSLSKDIAHSINHQITYNVWKKKLEGHGNSFTRHLYTIEGQKIFDDIKAKYASDPNFKGAVDDYVSDFEKLLGEISESDNNARTLKLNYLTSDTGKVYTMLAHASGQLT